MAAALERRGYQVTVFDDRAGRGTPTQAADPASFGLVVTSPGWRPDHPLLLAFAAAGVPVVGDVELAWRLGSPETRWYAVTGTNGKTTTTEMLAAMFAAGGLRSEAAGNIGTPLLDAVLREPPPEALAVELSSFELHWSSSLHPRAAAILNVAPDHLDWHGSFAAYAAAKAGIWARMGRDDVAVACLDDPVAARLLAEADGPRRVGVTLGEPGDGQLGVRGGWLADEAFGAGTLLPVGELRVAGDHNVADALAAAALALAAGVGPDAVATALRGYTTGAHRLATVAVTDDGVRWVDDSKATNPHAAARAVSAYDRVVWIAGGLNKGLGFDELAAEVGPRLVAAVLLGRCAGELRDALARHAPDVPVHEAADMHTAVTVARGLARPGDVVLLAPAAASMDMFRDYAERGEAFAAEVGALEGARS